MRIFITGATGYIGTAVTSAVINAGHEVTALVRRSTDATALESAGARVLRGELRELGRHRDAIAGHEAAIHAAADQQDPEAVDASALDTLLGIEGLRIVYTSGVWVFGSTGEAVVDEESEVDPISIVAWRPAHERRVLDRPEKLGAVIRPGCVYGGKQSLLSGFFAAAETGEPLVIVGDGRNRWAMVHQDDLADLYLKIVEERAGGMFHGVDDTRATLGQIAQAIVESIGSTSAIAHQPMTDAREQFGPFAEALALDQHVSSDATRSRLQWEPSISFIHSIERQWEEWNQAK